MKASTDRTSGPCHLRRPRHWALRLGVLAAVLCGLLLAGSAIALDPKSAVRKAPEGIRTANLAGIWRLDWTQSDSKPRIDSSADFGRPRGEGGGRDRPEQGAGRGRSEMGAGSRHPKEQSDDALLEWARARLAVQTLIIFQEGGGLEISENGRHVQRVDLDGVGPPQKAVGASRESRRGRWEHADLVTVSQLEEGATLTETFRLASGGLLLDVVARLQPGSNGPPILMHRVYKRYLGV